MEQVISDLTKEFIPLSVFSVVFLILLGFFGGLLSGFIGSGGAFVLTPGMMSLGVPATVAVASNMSHKFPKAMVGAYKRYRYGQVDIKLGVVMAVSAIAGVQLGIRIQEMILDAWGKAGSNLYVSLVFVIILTVLGTYMLFDSRRSMKFKTGGDTSGLAKKGRSISLPPMIKLKRGGAVSLWIISSIGFGTGLLAATIAVGGFIGVPGMIYVLGVSPLLASGTELLVAFVMGLSGTITWALGGFVDIRLTLLLLAGSLFGVQLGAIGTTYVNDYMVKLVMAVVMILVSVSRSFAIPNYLHDLGAVTLAGNIRSLLNNTSFVMMCVALTIGGLIILGSMWYRKRDIKKGAVA